MDYKEEYQKALERAKNGLPIDEVFPELKESDDEKMRKELLEYAKDEIRSYNNMVSGDYDSRDKEDKMMHEWWKKVVAYLEKQKEYISNNFDDVWEREDCSNIIAEGKKLTPEFKALFKKVCHAFFDKGVELTKKQKEQKPAESTALQKAFISSKIDYALEEKCDASDYADAILPTSVACGENNEEYKLHKIIEAAFIAGQKKEQKPAECIEFDNEFKNQISHLFASILNKEWKYDKNFVEYAAQQLLEYAKYEIKPVEWSEEDEECRKELIQYIEQRIGDGTTGQSLWKNGIIGSNAYQKGSIFSLIGNQVRNRLMRLNGCLQQYL